MAEELKPCPFCGASAKMLGNLDARWVVCVAASCNAQGPVCAASVYGLGADLKDLARRGWNARTAPEERGGEQ